jgi:nitroreductase
MGMDLRQAMRTQNACRYFRPDPVPDEVFRRAVEVARFAPSGGNRGPVRFVIVRDPFKKRRLGEWYLRRWNEVFHPEAAPASDTASGPAYPGRLEFTNVERWIRDGDHFAQHFGELPAVVVVCADLALVHPTDTRLGRLSVVGGASIYPMAQNLCLALRDQGLGTTLTTLLVADEPRVKALLEIPERFSTACHVAVGYPASGFPKKLRRPPVEELAFVDVFGRSLMGSEALA